MTLKALSRYSIMFATVLTIKVYLLDEQYRGAFFCLFSIGESIVSTTW